MFSISVLLIPFSTIERNVLEPTGENVRLKQEPWFPHIHQWYVIQETKSQLYGFTLKPTCPINVRKDLMDSGIVRVQDLFIYGRVEECTDAVDD